MTNRFWRRLAPAALAALLSVGSARGAAAQAVDEDGLRYASNPIEGVAVFSPEVRARVAGDARLMQAYADLLEGRRTSPFPWDTNTVVWWLAESGDPRWLPVFLRFARADEPDLDRFAKAAYGLARHAANPAARERLAALSGAPHRLQRFFVSTVLGHVNDEPARGVLRQMNDGTLGPRARDQRTRVLRGRGRAQGRGSWPCHEDETFQADGAGVHRCVARASTP